MIGRQSFGDRFRTWRRTQSHASGTSTRSDEEEVRERLAKVIPPESLVAPEEQARLIAAELTRLRSFRASPRDGVKPIREREH